jgi:uncharacterized membrane protein YdjX (TVP38/TMEM64 family)
MAEHPPSVAGKHVAQVHKEGHGHSVAAWTAVTVILVGALVMALAVVGASVLWFVVGGVVVLLGIVAGKVLAMAGYGEHKSAGRAEPTAGIR